MIVQLPQNKQAIVCECHAHLVEGYRWQYHNNGYSYRQVKKNGKITRFYMHRVIADTPQGLVVDHENGNKLDNRCSNLRNCTQAQNIMAGRGWYRSLPKNIYRTKNGTYNVKLNKNGKSVHIGNFTELNDAIREADKARKELYGRFSRLC